MCPQPVEAPGLFDLPSFQLVPAWIVIPLLFVTFLLPLAVAFRAFRLFQGLARGQEQRSLVWLEILLGLCVVIFYSLFTAFILWIITLNLWGSTLDPQCVDQIGPRLILAHPGNVVGMLVFIVAGVGMWVSQQWYRRTKSRLEAGQSFEKMPAK